MNSVILNQLRAKTDIIVVRSNNKFMIVSGRKRTILKNPVLDKFYSERHNNIIYDHNTYKRLCMCCGIVKNINVDELVSVKSPITVHPYIEGQNIRAYFHKNKWCYATNNKINMHDMSFFDVFDKIYMEKNMNETLCYYFTLCHTKDAKNRLVETNKVILNFVTHAGTLDIVKYITLPGIESLENIHINGLSDVADIYKQYEKYNRIAGYIICNGLLINEYSGQTCIRSLCIKTSMYKEYDALFPRHLHNLSKMYMSMFLDNTLDIYQKLSRDDGVFPEKQLALLLKHVSMNINNVYHNTRKGANKSLYGKLNKSYKHVLYELHGQYLSTKKRINKKVVYDMLLLNRDVVCVVSCIEQYYQNTSVIPTCIECIISNYV